MIARAASDDPAGSTREVLMPDLTTYRPKNGSYLRHWFRRNEGTVVRIALGVVSFAITIGFAFLFFGRR